MDDETAVFYFRQLLLGLQFSHKEGIIHRDLKPENILVYENEELKIGDFGLGKYINVEASALTSHGKRIGTNVYSPPEQLKGLEVDERGDIYSLGKILYEMITSQLPVYIEPNTIRNSKLSYLIKKATQDNKDRRYNSIHEMLVQLDMLTVNNGIFRSTSQQFNDYFEKYSRTNDSIEIKKIFELLISNSDDFILYTQQFMILDDSTLLIGYEKYMEELKEVILHFCSLVNTRHSFSFTDKLADFLITLLYITQSDTDIYKMVLERALLIGYEHNRFYIGEKIANIFNLIEDTEHILVLGEVFEENIRATIWLNKYLVQSNLAQYLKQKIHEISDGRKENV